MAPPDGFVPKTYDDIPRKTPSFFLQKSFALRFSCHFDEFLHYKISVFMCLAISSSLFIELMF